MNGSVDIDTYRDEDLCEIIARSFNEDAPEWRRLDDGRTICTAFFEEGHQTPMPRCERTADMFDDARGSQ